MKNNQFVFIEINILRVVNKKVLPSLSVSTLLSKQRLLNILSRLSTFNGNSDIISLLEKNRENGQRIAEDFRKKHGLDPPDEK